MDRGGGGRHLSERDVIKRRRRERGGRDGEEEGRNQGRGG